MKRTTPEEVLEILEEINQADETSGVPFTRTNAMSDELREFIKDEDGYVKYLQSTQKV